MPPSMMPRPVNLTLEPGSILAALLNETHGGVDAATHTQAVIRDLRLGIENGTVAEKILEYQAILAAVLRQNHAGVSARIHRQTIVSDMRTRIMATKSVESMEHEAARGLQSSSPHSPHHGIWAVLKRLPFFQRPHSAAP